MNSSMALSNSFYYGLVIFFVVYFSTHFMMQFNYFPEFKLRVDHPIFAFLLPSIHSFVLWFTKILLFFFAKFPIKPSLARLNVIFITCSLKSFFELLTLHFTFSFGAFSLSTFRSAVWAVCVGLPSDAEFLLLRFSQGRCYYQRPYWSKFQLKICFLFLFR